MKKYVFIRVEEGEEKRRSCQLLSGDSAMEFLKNPTTYLDAYDDGTLLDSWVVPDDLENATASGCVRDVFNALLALDILSDFPAVSDLFATIFEAGYQLALHKENKEN
jgi:hypothetical protein